ncbi:hypothetical protein PSPO01_12896 [Paraphaeosphaeria sporulosa]
MTCEIAAERFKLGNCASRAPQVTGPAVLPRAISAWGWYSVGSNSDGMICTLAPTAIITKPLPQHAFACSWHFLQTGTSVTQDNDDATLSSWNGPFTACSGKSIVFRSQTLRICPSRGTEFLYPTYGAKEAVLSNMHYQNKGFDPIHTTRSCHHCASNRCNCFPRTRQLRPRQLFLHHHL